MIRIRAYEELNNDPELKLNHWRSLFMKSKSLLGNGTAGEAATTPEGRAKLEEIFAMMDARSTTCSTQSLSNIDPPVGWLRWKLGLSDEVEDGALIYAAEETFYRGSASVAAYALNEDGGAEGGKTICNVCLKEGVHKCSKCSSRRYCSRECQLLDWKDHKKYCRPARTEMSLKQHTKLPMLQKWKSLRAYVNCQYDQFHNTEMGPRPTWIDFLERVQRAGLVTKKIVDTDSPGNTPKLEKALAKLDENFKLLYDFYFLSLTELAVEKHGTPVNRTVGPLSDAEKLSFDGRLKPLVYKELPQLNTGVDVTFSCYMIDKKTGMKVFNVMAHWQLYDTDLDQNIYTHCVKSHTKPAFLELQRAVHCMIVAPTGQAGGSDRPHRPKYIHIFNRWGKDYFDAVQSIILDAGIACGFQSREDAERACEEEGTDPDGINLVC
jgi:hypothetical protein